jgi:hypothetical protein
LSAFGWLNPGIVGEVPRALGLLEPADPALRQSYVRSSALCSAPIKAGLFVVRRSTDADGDLSLPGSAADITNRPRGIVIVPSDFEQRRLGIWQYDAFDPVNYLSNGKVWVSVESPVAEFGAVFARFAAGPGGSDLGALRGDADSNTCALVAKAQFRTHAQRYALVALNLP